MFEQHLGLDEEFRSPTPPVDLDDPQPWFLLITDPILEEEKKEEESKFPWPPGAPRPIIITKTKVELQEVLDFICKPNRFEFEGQRYRQQVSDEPVNRTYVQGLSKDLELSLAFVRSSNAGFCPYRNRIYTDMFGEVIRIVTVMMKERGIILLKVKDDLQTTMKNYEKLYKSSMAYGIRKQLKLEQRKLDMEIDIQGVRDNTALLEEMVEAFRAKSTDVYARMKKEREEVVNKKNHKLRLLKNITITIERTIFKIIRDLIQKQRMKFLKTVLALKMDDEEEEEVSEEDITGLFTEKPPTERIDMESRVIKSNSNFVKLSPPFKVVPEKEGTTFKLYKPKEMDPYMFSIQEIVNCIVPPREWEENGETWMQQLSIELGSRHDIKTLISDLDARLGQLKVRRTGFCPARSQLYEDAFDELIRQITLQCAEQGVLLMRIRNESRMTLKAYQTLYENINAMAVQKIEEVKVSKANLEEQVKELTEELLQLDYQLIVEQHKYKMIERRTNELTEAITRTQENDIHYLGKGIHQIEVITKSLCEVVPMKTERT